MKKVLCCLLALLGVVMLLFGCGQPDTPSASPSPKASSEKTPLTKAPEIATPVLPAKEATPKAATPKPQPAAADFYKGKVIQLIVGHSPGGGWDTWARMLAPYLEKHTGATIVIKNVEGASGKVALTQIRDQSDGLTLGMMILRSSTLDQIFDPAKMKYDLTKFNYLGIVTGNPEVAVVGAKSGIKNIEDLMKIEDLKWAVDTPESGKAVRARILSLVINKPIRIVTGYSGSATENLAVMRVEAHGANPGLTCIPLIESGDLIGLTVFEKERVKALPNVPTIYELRKLTPEEKELIDSGLGLEPGRAVLMPPGVSKEKVDFMKEALRKACMEPGLQEKGEKFNEPVDYQPGEVVEKALNEALKMSEEKKVKLAGLAGIKVQ